MTGQYIVQGIFALAGITSLLASLLNWNWFFTTRKAAAERGSFTAYWESL